MERNVSRLGSIELKEIVSRGILVELFIFVGSNKFCIVGNNCAR